MSNDKLVYKVVIWLVFMGGGISLWKEKEALILCASVYFPN